MKKPVSGYENQILIGHIRERNVVRKKAAVCGEERCVTSLKTAAKETRVADAEKKNTSSHSGTFLCAVSNTIDETIAEVLGENIPLLIDSGAVANIVSKKIYERTK